MPRHDITITPNTPSPGRHRITVDGHDISNAVSSATLWLEPDGFPELELTLRIVETKTLTSPNTVVSISDDVRDALIRLGWTPPAE